MSDQQPNVSEEQGGQPQEDGGAPEQKAEHAFRDSIVAAGVVVAGVIALATLLVQHAYLILFITVGTCIALTAIYYIIPYSRRAKNRRIAVVFVVLLVVVGGTGFGIGLATAPTQDKPGDPMPSPNLTLAPTPTSSTPTSTPAPISRESPSPNPVQVEIRPPSVIHAGKAAKLDGTVTGLSQASLWIIEQPSNSPGTLVISGDGPVATSDGPWKLSATEVGDSSDIGNEMGFVAISADKSCSERLSKIVQDAGQNEAKIDPGLYPGCTKVGPGVDVPVIE